MIEQATTTQTTAPDTAAVSEIANRPLILDEYPVDDGTVTINVWLREGDDLATMRMTEESENDDEEAVTTEIDAYLTIDELYHLGMAAGQALARLGNRANLVGLIQGLVDELSEMK